MGLFDAFKKKNKQEEKEGTAQDGNVPAAPEGGLPDCRPQDFLFEIRDIFALKEQGCVLVGEALNGEITPDAKAAYIDQNGRAIFHCTIHSIEQNGVKMKKASACYMGPFGPHFAFLIKDFAPNAFQKGNYLYLEAEAGTEPTPLQLEFDRLRMPWQERKELEGIFGREDMEEALKRLSVQETACLASMAGGPRPQADAGGAPEKEKVELIYRALVEKVKAMETVFLLSDKSTGFPFLNNGFVDIYSKKEYAEMAVLYYAEQFRELEVRELPPSQPDKAPVPVGEGNEKKGLRVPAFVLFYYLGMELVRFDNGFCRVVLKRGDVLPPPDYTGMPAAQAPVDNPALRLRILDFFGEVRWKVNYDKREAVLKAKEDAMLKEIAASKFLIPMRYDGRAVEKSGGRQIAFQKDTKFMFAVIKNNAGEMFTPIFTDFTEFSKIYPPKEWGAAVVTIQDAVRINKGKGIVINPSGENLVLNDKAIGAVLGMGQTGDAKTGTDQTEK